jgi:hypothetical protein
MLAEILDSRNNIKVGKLKRLTHSSLHIHYLSKSYLSGKQVRNLHPPILLGTGKNQTVLTVYIYMF